MKFLVVLSAALVLASAQRRFPVRQQAQPQPQETETNNDQQVAEQNYNNYQQQQQQDYSRKQQSQQQDYRQQQEQDYRQQQQAKQAEEYRQQQQAKQAEEYRQQQQAQQYRQQQQQELRQAKPIDDFRPKTSLETTTFVPIIRFDKEQGTDGSYKTAYETGNSIQAQEQGFLKSVGEDQNALVQHGSYSYTAPDGQIITVEYTADEFGFRVKGDHIPTPPPVSPEIQKGLDLIYAGIKANEERAALEANNPEAAKTNQEKAALDYKGFYYPQ